MIKKEHVQSTNLSYLEAVHEAMAGVGEKKEEVMRIVSGPQPVTKQNDVWKSRAAMVRDRRVKVDIVAENGLVWIKVIARNAKAFRHEIMGLEWEQGGSSSSELESESESDEEEEEKEATTAAAGDFDNLPIFKKAREYLETAKAHHVQFHTPIVVFAFMRIQPKEDIFVQRIMDRLSDMGIVVHLQGEQGLKSTYMPAFIKSVGEGQDLDHFTTQSINMDVNSALALLSELSHHVCLPNQISAIPLQVQAEREAQVPVLAQMIPYITGSKRLFMIQSAYDRLKEIVDIVGGPHEKARFNYLFRKHLGLELEFDQALWTILPSLSVQVMQDAASEKFSKLLEEPPDGQHKSKLNNGRKIRTKFSEFHAKIFGSGDYYQMTTMTGIQWLGQSLSEAGLQGTFIVSHEPRSLAENKMSTAARK